MLPKIDEFRMSIEKFDAIAYPIRQGPIDFPQEPVGAPRTKARLRSFDRIVVEINAIGEPHRGRKIGERAPISVDDLIYRDCMTALYHAPSDTRDGGSPMPPSMEQLAPGMRVYCHGSPRERGMSPGTSQNARSARIQPARSSASIHSR